MAVVPLYQRTSHRQPTNRNMALHALTDLHFNPDETSAARLSVELHDLLHPRTTCAHIVPAIPIAGRRNIE